jgi:hypothetical protein
MKIPASWRAAFLPTLAVATVLAGVSLSLATTMGGGGVVHLRTVGARGGSMAGRGGSHGSDAHGGSAAAVGGSGAGVQGSDGACSEAAQVAAHALTSERGIDRAIAMLEASCGPGSEAPGLIHALVRLRDQGDATRGQRHAGSTTDAGAGNHGSHGGINGGRANGGGGDDGRVTPSPGHGQPPRSGPPPASSQDGHAGGPPSSSTGHASNGH